MSRFARRVNPRIRRWAGQGTSWSHVGLSAPLRVPSAGAKSTGPNDSLRVGGIDRGRANEGRVADRR
ncbi:MAG TPA: hypothetical protein DCQ98_15110 [Planctomycetaceae bacterium]|nr:hypothetical protein [Planctomycetaceae bacterium]